MKRIRKIVVRGGRAIVLAAVTAVAVAWWLAYKVDGSWTARLGPRFSTDVARQVVPKQPRYAPGGVSLAQVSRTRGWGTEILEGTMVGGEDSNWAIGSLHEIVKGTPVEADVIEKLGRGEPPCFWWRADGWPLLALSAEGRWISPDALGMSKVNTGVLLSAEQVPPGTPALILPLRPIWSGLVINTVFYTLLWFLLFSSGDIAYRLRAALRHRRGQCIRCGYIVRPEQERCSECGHEVSAVNPRPIKSH